MLSASVYMKSLNHHGEEVCGDNYQMQKTDESKIFVLSDGLGSGIKASILAILTTEIITTMFENEIGIEDIVETITKTLPVCKRRGIAYSTFTIVQIYKNGNIKIVNYDNPEVVIIRNKSIYQPRYQESKINDKIIKKCELRLEKDDMLFMLTDGLLHAGLGNLMDFGWGWESIAQYLRQIYMKSPDLKDIVDNLIDLTQIYYGNKPGDDATLIGIKCIARPKVMIFSGPPLDRQTDRFYVDKFLNYNGKKVLCGGTTGNIVAKLSGQEIEINLDRKYKDLPPYGKMKNVELVTEGVLTIKKLNEMLSKCNNMYELKLETPLDAAEKLFSIIRDCDVVDMLIGRRVNVFYHNPALPFDMSIRSNLIRELSEKLNKAGKTVNVEYC